MTFYTIELSEFRGSHLLAHLRRPNGTHLSGPQNLWTEPSLYITLELFGRSPPYRHVKSDRRCLPSIFGVRTSWTGFCVSSRIDRAIEYQAVCGKENYFSPMMRRRYHHLYHQISAALKILVPNSWRLF